MNVPRWAIEEYPGSEKDFSIWLEQQFLNSKLITSYNKAFDEKTGEILDEELYQRVRAQAKFETLQRTLQFRSTVERSQLWQLYEANKSGWFRLLPPEFDTIEELLASMVEGLEEGTSEYSDISFLVKHVIPMLAKSGMSVEDVLGIAINTSKARAAVPLLRQIVRENIPNEIEEMPEKEREIVEIKTVSLLKEVVEKVIDSTVPVREFKQELRELRGKQTETPKPIVANKYLLNNQIVYLIPADTNGQSRAVEISLRSIVCEFQNKFVDDLLHDIQDVMNNKRL
jgi:hypothetical protein